MLITIPLITFFLLWKIYYNFEKPTASFRSSLLKTILTTGILIQLNTELLSSFQSFTQLNLAFFWLIVLAGTLWVLMENRAWKFKFPQLPLQGNIIDISLLTTIGIIFLLTGITAIVAPPNNWDSMTYHMSRVAHWAQNKSIEFYPTSMPRQLWASPWAEYAIAQLYLLMQSDRLANCIQWMSMVASVVGCSLTAKLLGANRRGEIITAALCASLPMGILESSSTQNDYAVALWMVLFVYFGLQWILQNQSNAILGMTASLALALATKNTSILFLLPFVIWFTITKYRYTKKTKYKTIITTFIIITLALTFNILQYARNQQLAGNPFSLTSESKTVTNEQLKLTGAFSNAIRYLGLNLCSHNQKANQLVRDSITQIHKILGLNVVDPRFTMGEEYKIKQDIHEDNSCNTAYTILFIIVLVSIIRGLRALPPENTYYLIALAGGFFLFCLTAKWQPWGNRLLLPLTIISVPWTGTILAKKFPRIQIIAGFACIVLSIPWLVHNRSRPLINSEFTIFNKERNQQYFSNVPGEFFSYQRATQEVQQSGCKDIAIVMTQESWEYPLWPLLNLPKDKTLRLEHVNITNPSQQFTYPRGEFNPCIAIHDTAKGIASITINDSLFVKTNQYTYLSIYRKDPDGILFYNVLRSNFQQMLENSLTADLILHKAQSRGKLDQNILFESFQRRKLSVDYAEMLDSQALNKIYPELGTYITTKYIQGATLLMEGLSNQDNQKISQGQTLLDQWKSWFEENNTKIQVAFP